MKKVGLAIIGYGGMGHWHTARALDSDQVELTGIYDIAPERVQELKENGIHAYESLEALLADPRVELVTVCTPNHLHKPHVIQCLNAGKHVICEKPIAMNCAELLEMQAAAAANHRLLTGHQNRRWDTDYLGIQKVLDEGMLGDLRDIESRIHGSRGILPGWREDPEYGGGMLYDWGIHLIDQIMMLRHWAPVSSVRCEGVFATGKRADDGFRLTMIFEDGVRAFIEVDTCSFISMPRFYVRGRMGSAIVRDWRDPCEVVQCTCWDEDQLPQSSATNGPTRTMSPRNERTTHSFSFEKPVGDCRDFYTNFCAAIRGEAEQTVTPWQLRTVLSVMDAAFASMESGNAVAPAKY